MLTGLTRTFLETYVPASDVSIGSTLRDRPLTAPTKIEASELPKQRVSMTRRRTLIGDKFGLKEMKRPIKSSYSDGTSLRQGPR
jgi:hypothetical protein